MTLINEPSHTHDAANDIREMEVETVMFETVSVLLRDLRPLEIDTVRELQHMFCSHIRITHNTRSHADGKQMRQS